MSCSEARFRNAGSFMILSNISSLPSMRSTKNPSSMRSNTCLKLSSVLARAAESLVLGGGLGDLVGEELVGLLEVRAKPVIQFVDQAGHRDVPILVGFGFHLRLAP